MPSEIDAGQRLIEIAEATLQIAREEGPRAVTIRAVADRMGRSTTVITKFIPRRAALLTNALQQVRVSWDKSLADALDGQAGMDRLRALVNWTLDTDEDDAAVRRLWHEMLAKEDSDSEQWDAVRAEAHDEQVDLRRTLEESGIDAPEWLADVLFLVSRGYFVSTVEDPDEWAGPRARDAVNAMLDDLVATRAAPERS